MKKTLNCIAIIMIVSFGVFVIYGLAMDAPGTANFTQRIQD